MQCWIEISKEAILNNFMIFTRMLGEDAVIPILKSNAYGHGLREVYEALKDIHPKWIGVTYSSEAQILRDLGYKGRILNVGPILEEDLQKSFDLNVEITLADSYLIDIWLKLTKRPKIHVKIDTGLSRRGFSIEQLPTEITKLLPFKNEVIGIATHLANVEDVTNTDFAHLQINRLLQAIQLFKSSGFKNLLTHCASSASALLIKEPKLDLHRIGIAFYGLWPSEKTRLSYFVSPQQFDATLQPALSWKTRISSTRFIEEGTFVGYGCTFKAVKKLKIGVLPVGYFEGYPRLAAGRGAYVLVRGRRCSIIGRICMNMLMIDLDNSPNAEIGDVATLIGQDGNEIVSAEMMAQWVDTINYELVTRLNAEIPRYVTH